MGKGFFHVPVAVNEPVKTYEPGSPEREQVLRQYRDYLNGKEDIPMYIGGEEVRTGETARIAPPHDHRRQVGQYHKASRKHVDQAMDSALGARQAWAALSWENRASIFLKAAALIAGPYRARINAATMIAQSKNIHQAEIDAACELIDFLRFNVEYMAQIYNDQPESDEGIWNRVEYRPLEGFVYAITPFNFTAIAGNLPTSAAMMGNVVIWKPSDHQVFSAWVIMDVLREAGLPHGVINLIYGDPVMITDTLLSSVDFAGIHYTGSTAVFRSLWKKIGDNIQLYKSYPRIVGETGGKDFILAHPTAPAQQVATAITRGAFEFQGQKCSAASRVDNFITAVIHEAAFDKLASYIDKAKNDADAEIIAGGAYDKSKGYFIEPTVILTTDPHYPTMETELFGPVVTVYVYEDKDWDKTLTLVDGTSEYALTGAVMARDRYAIEQATRLLENSAGNFYINDKPTGAVVGQQPFGGARASGTNDKAGSMQNLLRWVSPRLIKETFVSPEDYRYPFLG